MAVLKKSTLNIQFIEDQMSNKKFPVVSGARATVRGDDVSGALRRVRKVLERDDRQKDLAKHEYFEKPSAVKKRNNETSARRAKRAGNDFQAMYRAAHPSGTKWMKSKRKRRKVLDAKAVFSRLSRGK